MNIAIIENDKVIDVIVCDSFELAKELTGATEVIDADENKAYINYTKVNGVWVSPYIEIVKPDSILVPNATNENSNFDNLT